MRCINGDANIALAIGRNIFPRGETPGTFRSHQIDESVGQSAPLVRARDPRRCISRECEAYLSRTLSRAIRFSATRKVPLRGEKSRLDSISLAPIPRAC